MLTMESIIDGVMTYHIVSFYLILDLIVKLLWWKNPLDELRPSSLLI